MNKGIEEEFISKFVVKDKRERLLYELNKPDKRFAAVHYRILKYLDERKIVLSGDAISEDKLKELIKLYAKSKTFYVMSDGEFDGEVLDVKKDFENCLYYLGTIIMIFNNDFAIYKDEQSFGAPLKIVLHI